ncbi:Bifunctional ligase/repressor BirA [bioreactor metagenome]|uniref:Bifunctional ligase/repressor BirA n=1 Tax=bioreactor metagenome TaxID=1076179 RepID=A0A644ZPH1_9ZZZZ
MNLDELKRSLAITPVSEWRAYEAIGSTNDEALVWLEEGAPDFSLVIADQQTKGRGRFQRRWITQPGASLAFTVLFRLNQAEQRQPISLYAPLAGLAVRQALEDQLGLQAQIKWPNDILLARKKTCGILVEGSWLGEHLQGIVVGIGINITAASLPEGAEVGQFPATWLEAHTPSAVDRFDLLAGVLNALRDWRQDFATPQFFATWQAHLAFMGEEVRIEQMEKEPIIGKATGIDSQGNLLLLLSDGQEIAVEVGDVHLRTTAEHTPEGRNHA